MPWYPAGSRLMAGPTSNIDDGWESERRDAEGRISTNAKFPDMKGLSGYLHQKGMRFGIYSSPGPETCGKFTGVTGS
jgi:hypothetical protein